MPKMKPDSDQEKHINNLIKHEKWDQAFEFIAAIEKRCFKNLQTRRKELLDEVVINANQENYSAAIMLSCKLLSTDRTNKHGLRNLAILLRRTNLYRSALYFARNYTDLYPQCPNGKNTLGIIYSDLGKHEEAIKVFSEAIAIDEKHSDSLINLANEYHIKADIDMAYIFASKAASINPNNKLLLLDFLTHMRRTCDFENIKKVSWLKLALNATNSQSSCSFLQLLTLCDDHKKNIDFLSIAKAWGDNLARMTEKPLKQKIHSLTKKNNRSEINIGFISADFRQHSVARFIAPLFEHLEEHNFKIFAFSTYKDESDKGRKYFQRKAYKFIDIESAGSNDLKELMAEHSIDILFDLTGFTKGSRTQMFASRLAPIQISWLGFPGTTGIANMDYIFVDKYLKPKEEYIREKILLTEGTSICFTDMPNVPTTPILPEEKRNYITFGTLNNPYKFTPLMISIWSKVMSEKKGSKFFFVRREYDSFLLRENLLKEFAKHDISEDRIKFFNNRLQGRHYLDMYNEIDICLDTYPVTGGTTTIDTLWMGVPLICKEGKNIHERISSSIMKNAGLIELIAANDDDYINKAISVANNIELRKEMRENLRDRLMSSILCDQKRFCRDFSNAIRECALGGHNPENAL